METIAGYMMVRQPSYNYQDNYIEISLLNSVNYIDYHGIERGEWYDLDTYFWERKLPDSFIQKYKDLTQSGEDSTSTILAKTSEEIECFMDIDKVMPLKNEIIVIASPILNDIKGEIAISSDFVEWLGYDIRPFGGWSLIRHAIFENRQLDLLKENPINTFGLFDTLDKMNQFLEEYKKLGVLDKVDPLIEDLYVEGIRIGRQIKLL